MESINNNISIDINNVDIKNVDINNVDINDKNIIFFKNLLSLLIILLNFPIIFCDFYYAIKDNSCVNQKMELILTMYDYLIVSGISSVIITFISILFIFYFEKIKTTKFILFNILFILFLYIIGLFTIGWNIIGSLIFWHYMDNNKCSNEVFNYLFASLIIKLIFCSSILFNSNKNK